MRIVAPTNNIPLGDRLDQRRYQEGFRNGVAWERHLGTHGGVEREDCAGCAGLRRKMMAAEEKVERVERPEREEAGGESA